MHPKVSVLLPNFNHRRFLEERIQTIFSQTFTNWQLVIVDNYSDDGSWEFFQDLAKKDSRVSISQAARRGMYDNWNNCIRLAKGEYVYIATSDDTMMPTCLEKMVEGLETHKECDICDVGLKVVDERGDEVLSWHSSDASKFYGDLMNKSHIRLAPYDGILCTVFYPVYTSITQLLIRRSVFDKVGLFRNDFGSLADIEWGMRASLVHNVLHLPDILATWRKHSSGATALTWRAYPKSQLKDTYCKMVQSAFAVLQIHSPNFYKRINQNKLLFRLRHEQFAWGLSDCCGYLGKILFIIKFFFIRADVVSRYIIQRISNRREQKMDYFKFISEELQRLGLTHSIRVLD